MDFVNFLFHKGDINRKQLEEIKLNEYRDHRKSADIIINRRILPKKEILKRLSEWSQDKS